ncbi:LuxR C-terminal-related transcriptional regulator [Streptomyces sp. NBC_01239]|uniref:helix-turn-helix transcriptional regulator n=1 Tax=Streptomyces sp. NBC_01239 TaxID=2903792 RepID=UPI00224E4900|nr:LuxR C-terminal-related transcriptional regulator [Streptomyces sp. NBC_01239]MCX4817397.1 LuxR C-terminal-related transcriptional regulator [Streptomyces sp. NBC_01239]
MTSGPAGAYERLLAVAVAALHERDPERLWPLVAASLPELCGGEALIYKLGEWTDRTGAMGLSPAAAAHLGRIDDDAMAVLRRGYPFADHYATAGAARRPGTAHRMAGRGWVRSRTAGTVSRLLDADHVLAIPLPGTATPVTGCLVYRAGTDFTEDQVRAAEQLQPLLAGVEQQRQLLERWRATTAPASVPELSADSRLTPRQVTVLLLLADALTASAIAHRLGISIRTVHKHVEGLYRKLGTRDRVSTVLRAQEIGLLPGRAGR